MTSKLRNENQIKVKQPLKTLFVNGNDDVAKAVEIYKDIIESELNIKNVVIERDNSKFNIEYLGLDFRRAGAVLKGDVQKVKNLLTNATDDEMARMVIEYKLGSVTVGEFAGLDSSLFTLQTKPKGDYVINNNGDITVVLDITLDRNLMLEGLSRELIRATQVLRKDANFNIDDRIYVELSTQGEDLSEIIEKFRDKIKSELLIKEFTTITAPEAETTVEIGDETITIKMSR